MHGRHAAVVLSKVCEEAVIGWKGKVRNVTSDSQTILLTHDDPKSRHECRNVWV